MYIYVPLTKSLFKSAGIRVSLFFSMLPSILKHYYSVEPTKMYFPRNSHVQMILFHGTAVYNHAEMILFHGTVVYK
jgi:hypothetical protein